MRTVRQIALATTGDPAVAEIVRILERVRDVLMIVLTGLAIVALTYAGYLLEP